jgi:hypothetical protein
VGPSPAGYQYIDYWFFYRYNQGFQDIGNHAGDWESVTVAPATSGQTFEFAEFSEHGNEESFLRDNLECDNNAAGSCGTESGSSYSGQHVMTFPAAGSHANYPQPNSGPLHRWQHRRTCSVGEQSESERADCLSSDGRPGVELDDWAGELD